MTFTLKTSLAVLVLSSVLSVAVTIQPSVASVNFAGEALSREPSTKSNFDR